MGARTQVGQIKDRSEGALQGAAESDWLQRLARGGLAARGLVYIVIGFLGVQVALGHKQERADKQGALQAVVRQPLGKVLVLGLAVGFAGYALWRFVEAATGPPNEDDARKAVVKRVFYAARGVLYTTFCISAVRVLLQSNKPSDSNAQATWTGRVLNWPGGTWLVALTGLAVIVGGAYVGWRGISRKFRKHLKSAQMSRIERRWILRTGTVGMLARMMVTVLIGVFLIGAALQHAPDKSVGIDGALKSLADRPYGPPLLIIVAIGLAAYGVYSFGEARYRRVGPA